MTVPVRFAILRSIHFLYISRFLLVYISSPEQLITFLKLPVSVILLPTPSAWEFPPVYARSTPTNITFSALNCNAISSAVVVHRTSCFESFCLDFFCYFFCLSIPILICDINRSLIIIQNRRGRCRQKYQWNLFCIQSLHLLIHMRLWICYDDSIWDNAFLKSVPAI